MRSTMAKNKTASPINVVAFSRENNGVIPFTPTALYTNIGRGNKRRRRDAKPFLPDVKLGDTHTPLNLRYTR